MLKIVTEYKKGHKFDYFFTVGDSMIGPSSAPFSPSAVFKDKNVFATTDGHLIVHSCHEKIVQKEVANPFCTEIVWTFSVPNTDSETMLMCNYLGWPTIEIGNQNILVLVKHVPTRPRNESECQYRKRLDTNIMIGYILDGKTGFSKSFFTHTCFGSVNVVKYGSSHFAMIGQEELDNYDTRSMQYRTWQDSAVFDNEGVCVGTATLSTDIQAIPKTDYLLMHSSIYRVDPDDITNIENPKKVWGLDSIGPIGPININVWDTYVPSVAYWVPNDNKTPKIAFFSRTPIRNSKMEFQPSIWVFSLCDGKLLFSGSCGNVYIQHIMFSSSGNKIFVHHQKNIDQNVYKWTEIKIEQD